MSALGKRLAKLERSAGAERSGVSWLAVRQWLGHVLTPEEATAVAEHRAANPYDPTAPVDTRGLSQRAREWLGFRGPASAAHVATIGEGGE